MCSYVLKAFLISLYKEIKNSEKIKLFLKYAMEVGDYNQS